MLNSKRKLIRVLVTQSFAGSRAALEAEMIVLGAVKPQWMEPIVTPGEARWGARQTLSKIIKSSAPMHQEEEESKTNN